ncbi:hypothetical protein BN000_03964 [Mycobacterium europaeum]|uniref:Uncharacterized protein n=1 Tax=Mycobacterium europaeum TaxID=761804 RepID=A0A0U1DJI1_9MYCO|nr:hypothetical protein BN000_03964 [Mycobacterium europaeum]
MMFSFANNAGLLCRPGLWRLRLDVGGRAVPGWLPGPGVDGDVYGSRGYAVGPTGHYFMVHFPRRQ